MKTQPISTPSMGGCALQQEQLADTHPRLFSLRTCLVQEDYPVCFDSWSNNAVGVRSGRVDLYSININMSLLAVTLPNRQLNWSLSICKRDPIPLSRPPHRRSPTPRGLNDGFFDSVDLTENGGSGSRICFKRGTQCYLRLRWRIQTRSADGDHGKFIALFVILIALR